MLTAFVPVGGTLKRVDDVDLDALPQEAVWIDLKTPSPGEDKAVEKLVGIEIPTREDMQEIEISSRLYTENAARYMTATLMCATDSGSPRTTPVSFILTDHRLVTVRYDEPKPFLLVAGKLARGCQSNITGDHVLIDLLDAVIDRNADILERAGADVDSVSNQIFEPSAERGHARTYSQILLIIGKKGDLVSKVRESLVTIGRLISFVAGKPTTAAGARSRRRSSRPCSATCSR